MGPKVALESRSFPCDHLKSTVHLSEYTRLSCGEVAMASIHRKRHLQRRNIPVWRSVPAKCFALQIEMRPSEPAAARTLPTAKRPDWATSSNKQELASCSFLRLVPRDGRHNGEFRDLSQCRSICVCRSLPKASSRRVSHGRSNRILTARRRPRMLAIKNNPRILPRRAPRDQD